MNVLFMLIGSFRGVDQHEIYPDLVRKFHNEGHRVFVVCSNERRTNKGTELIEDGGVQILRVRIGNITKCNAIEKGISTVLIERQYRNAIRKYFRDVKFDLVAYATPPITLYGAVRYVKKRDGAQTYLMLKDIFPQNAVDLGMLRKNGLKGLLYRYFKRKERQLYKISDHIGCMSEGNRRYLLAHNPQIAEEKAEICPNCFEVRPPQLTDEEKQALRRKYEIPEDRTVFVYGGNLGKPQGIPFFLECLKTQKDNEHVFFLIVGGGTEYDAIHRVIESEQYQNVKLYARIPSEDFENLMEVCDCGMVFLDHRFTIPNYPSRMLPYMQAKLPLLACTDAVTDLRDLIAENEIGWWCESTDPQAFAEIVAKMQPDDMKEKGNRAYALLRERYDIAVAYNAIAQHFTEEQKQRGRA